MGTSFHSAPDAGPVIFQGRTLAMLPSRPLALAASPCRVTLVRGGRGGIRQLSTRGKGAGGARHARGSGRGVVREGHWRGTWDAPRFSSRDRSSSGALWSAERRCRASEIHARPKFTNRDKWNPRDFQGPARADDWLKLDRHSRITVSTTGFSFRHSSPGYASASRSVPRHARPRLREVDPHVLQPQRLVHQRPGLRGVNHG